tara:strand:- start:37693 stop:37917 length:225 start_codon:yes stop_codon:yes gene_type:complete
VSVTNKIKHEIKGFWNEHGVLPSRCFAGKGVSRQLRIESSEIKPIEILGVKVVEHDRLADDQVILIHNEKEFTL